MKQFGFPIPRWRYGLGLIVACCLWANFPQHVHAADADAMIKAFVKSVQNDASLDDDDKQRIQETVKRLSRDERGKRMVITEGLRTGWKAFDQANRDLGNERYADAVKKLTPLMDSRNRFLAAASRFLLARVYVMEERFEDALPLLTDLIENRAKDSMQIGDAMYAKATVQIQMLERKAAEETLQAFLDKFPDAPARMRKAAMNQLDDLANVDFGSLADIGDRMDVSRRQLVKADSGKKTQNVQDEVVAMLSELIDEMEKKGGT